MVRAQMSSWSPERLLLLCVRGLSQQRDELIASQFSGFDVADQIDGKRELPMATGVIPLQDFMDALVIIGYDGPLRAEPFNQPLRDMEDEAAVKATYDAMAKAFALVAG